VPSGEKNIPIASSNLRSSASLPRSQRRIAAHIPQFELLLLRTTRCQACPVTRDRRIRISILEAVQRHTFGHIPDVSLTLAF
jgi:hypothetical protein